jgi:NAD(P)H-hydrate epimerase
MWIATAEQMRRIDRRSIEEFGLPSRVLMERAGFAVFEKLREMLPEGGSVAVVCGRGNNGGDGFVIARLAREAGYFVDCLVASSQEELAADSLEVLEPLLRSGLQPTFADSEYWVPKLQALAAHDLIVDAIFGTGLSSRGNDDLRTPASDTIHAINRAETLVLAVDVPSGIEADTGKMIGAAVVADATVTFGMPKPFLFCGDGLESSGDWSIADIGFPSSLLEQPTGAALLDCRWVGERLPVRSLGSHKGANGHVLVVAGSNRMRGAASLCARAALRCGAGLVTVAAIEEVCAAVSAQLPEALLLPLPGDKGVLAPEAAEMILSHKADVGLFGPGLTHVEPVKALLSNLFNSWDRPAVIDADALNVLASLPSDASGDGAAGKGEFVYTPHPGEMGRLLGSSAQEVEADRFAAIESTTEKFGGTLLLKGRHSIVSAPGESMLVNTTGNSGLATGGSGDVLSGVIAALLAQGLDPYEAAACGMFWHGLSADLCVESIGTIGYTPSEVADTLPKARDTILEKCNSDT